MSEVDITFNIVTVIVCDDIRREDNGKQILIGVYNDVAYVPAFPALIPLSFWLQAMPSDAGPARFGMRLVAGEAEFFNNTATLVFPKKELSSVAIGQIPCSFQQPSELQLQVKINQQENWRTIKVVRVEKNPALALEQPPPVQVPLRPAKEAAG